MRFCYNSLYLCAFLSHSAVLCVFVTYFFNISIFLIYLCCAFLWHCAFLWSQKCNKLCVFVTSHFDILLTNCVASQKRNNERCVFVTSHFALRLLECTHKLECSQSIWLHVGWNTSWKSWYTCWNVINRNVVRP